MTETETAQSISDRAAAWVARIDRAPLDAAEQATLESWLAGDDRRRGAFLRADTAWTMLDRASVKTADAPRPDERDDHVAQSFVSRRWFVWGGGAVAASLAAGWGVALWRGVPARIETAIGEIRRVPLADGSVVALNTATKLTVALKPATRDLGIEEGEAWFQVAKDRRRPFVVTAGDVRVRAVGTAFSVRRRDTGADVQVTEGVVEVWSVDRKDDVRRIVAGTRTFVSDTAGPATPVAASADIGRALAWRGGELVFDGNTVADAAVEFNRYNAVPLQVDDPSLAQERVVGRFRTNEPQAFAQSVGIMFGAHADITADRITLSRK